MRVRSVLAILALGVFVLGAYAGDSPVRAIEVKDLKLGKAEGSVMKPQIIASAEELAKAIPDEATLAKVKKEVDFGKQKLLFFAWSGSGGDKLGFSSNDKGTEVTITYKGGLTRDLRPHYYLLVLPKDATYKIDTGKGDK
jgi:hypothetical protein